MTQFRNILVGVDPLRLAESSSASVPATTACGVRQAIELAAKGSTQLTFLAIVDVPKADAYLTEPDRRQIVERLDQSARLILDELVQAAVALGVMAQAALEHGAAWSEIIRRAERDRHDLVIVGRSGHDVAWRDLLGRTAANLIHRCPVPVWVVQPQADCGEQNILVASDLSEVSLRVLETAAALRSRLGGSLHLLHVLENPLAGLLAAGLGAESAEQFFKHAHAEARGTLDRQIATLGDAGGEIDVQVVAGRRDPVLLEFLSSRRITLLALGTSARGTLAQLALGSNTAERLLPYLPCSVLVVK